MIFSLLFSLAACRGNFEQKVVDPVVEFDSAFCERLMPGLGGGITGGDGSISIDLKDGRSLFMWGDSFFGDVINDKRAKDTKFVIGNTFTIIDKNGQLKTLYSGTKENPLAFIEADQDGKSPVWYWPGHGFVENGILHLFMSKFHKVGEGSFGFEYLCCDYFRLDVETMKIIDKENFKAANENNVHYGHAVLPYRGEIYVYGTRADAMGMAEVHVSKAKLINDKLVDFSYWDGAEWQTDARKSQRIAGITKSVSEQFNVVELEEKIALVSQDRSGNVKDIYSFIADKPEGPFSNEKLLYKVEESGFEVDSMMTYNAMVHPQYRKDGKVLMCYNVNTYSMTKLFEKASLYQPRFIWVPVEKIVKYKNSFKKDSDLIDRGHNTLGNVCWSR